MPNVFERSKKIIDHLFGQNNKINDTFIVINNCSKNCGKIYLPLSLSLEHLITQEAQLGFDIRVEVRKNKMILHY